MLIFIDNFLNSITMYRLVLYGLIIEAVIAIIFGFTGLIPFSGWSLLFATVFFLFVCYLSNLVFGKIFRAVLNAESSAITGMILFFIFGPPNNSAEVLPLLAASLVAMASKYILAIHKKHIFNPAATAAVILGLVGFGGAAWWVATPVLLPFTALLGLLIVRKIRRFVMVSTFLLSAIVSIYLFNGLQSDPAKLIAEIFVSWPLVFFATVMFTEPFTTPPTQKLRIVYGILVGFLFGAQFHIGPIYSTPELALIIGNIFSFLVSSKQKLFLSFKEKVQLSPNIYDFVFTSTQKFNFNAGQYMEWTLPLTRTDSRGNRRYFTVASAPTEDTVHIGIRVSEQGSTFKKSLMAMKKDDQLVAAALSGDFTLPKKLDEKLVFIAGGIGITPFRSMVQYLIDTKQKCDIVLFYASSEVEDFVYKEIFEEAKSLGVKLICVLTKKEGIPQNWKGPTGRISDDMIKAEVPDYLDRKFYLSGPPGMVNGYKQLLHQIKLKRTNIITDYFPGY